MANGSPVVFDRNAAQSGTAITHAANSADVTIGEPGSYFAIFSGTAAPQQGATLPLTALVTFTLNGTTLSGPASQHVFTGASETSPLAASTVFTVTAPPATLRVNSSGGALLYSNTSLNVFKI